MNKRSIGESVSMACAVLALASPASAQVFQIDSTKTPLPQPVGSAELNLITQSFRWNAQTQSYNDPATGVVLTTPIVYGGYYSPPAFPRFVDGDAITLEGLFKWRHESIDPVKDAHIAPGQFSPGCGFSAQLVLKGGNCNFDFGWYNVLDSNATPPSVSQLNLLIPSSPGYLNCLDNGGQPSHSGFCPLAWDNRSPLNLSLQVWTPRTFDSGKIKSDPKYAGGDVAFALIANPTSQCSQTKYSVYEHNQRNSDGVPWVTTLIYQSTVDPEGYYLAFEDLPMPDPAGTSFASPDWDFNDAVFYVSGINTPTGCPAANKSCATGKQGACSAGRTACGPNGALVCQPVLAGKAEICDNVDNDCNGIVDDGTGICPDPSRPICFQGSCVASCLGRASACPQGLTCAQSGACVDETCVDVRCDTGQVCEGGSCVDPCAGVACPYGSLCELGHCVDPCRDVTCPSGRVCEQGLCLADCSCRGCAPELTCQSDGRCADTTCAGVTCPGGGTCMAGQCSDPCAGVVCLEGTSCSNGVCLVVPSAQGDSGAAGTSGGPGTEDASAGTGGSDINDGGSAQTGGEPGSVPPIPALPDPGCSCRVSCTPRPRFDNLSAVLGLILLASRRRRRAWRGRP
jgi:hypothetical protein